jgi:hypothetical protein
MSDYPNDADGDALRRVATDSDMSRPMAIDFMVAVPDEQSGRAVAEAAQARGYATSVKRDEPSGGWTCYCTKSMLATHAGVLDAQAELDRVAQPHGGHSDGWGTFGNASS